MVGGEEVGNEQMGEEKKEQEESERKKPLEWVTIGNPFSFK